MEPGNLKRSHANTDRTDGNQTYDPCCHEGTVPTTCRDDLIEAAEALFDRMPHHHDDDHGASDHAGQPGLLWEVGLFDPGHRVWLHGGGHGCELGPWTLLTRWGHIHEYTHSGKHAQERA